LHAIVACLQENNDINEFDAIYRIQLIKYDNKKQKIF